MPSPAAVLWALRAVWVALPFTSGPALAAALDERSGPVRTTASVLLWAAWGAVVLALLVPRPAGLTLVRVVAPAGVVAAGLAGAGVLGGSPSGVAAAVALVSVVAAAALALLPEVGFSCVNGAAYGEERRHLLRAPGAVLIGPLPLAWAAAVAAPVAGPLLLAARQWVAGGVVLAAGGAAAVVAVRALHGLTQRWAVLVPAGLVLKDHAALLDPVLFRRGDVEVLHPAPVDAAEAGAVDLTAGAPGLALELRLGEEVPVVRVVPGRPGGEPLRVDRVLFSPTRPGALLADAEARRLRVR